MLKSLNNLVKAVLPPSVGGGRGNSSSLDSTRIAAAVSPSRGYDNRRGGGGYSGHDRRDGRSKLPATPPSYDPSAPSYDPSASYESAPRSGPGGGNSNRNSYRGGGRAPAYNAGGGAPPALNKNMMPYNPQPGGGGRGYQPRGPPSRGPPGARGGSSSAGGFNNRSTNSRDHNSHRLRLGFVPTRACNYFNSPRGCSNGDRCTFLHNKK